MLSGSATIGSMAMLGMRCCALFGPPYYTLLRALEHAEKTDSVQCCCAIQELEIPVAYGSRSATRIRWRRSTERGSANS